ncbi:DUF4197 domain-containing protein [Aquisalimonas sp.]|uniref:DUF4197 domain-containing protein n=1 Tax=Aquisalimonas sp. TaxID=1872621 RepID=UPI0025B976FE|nr:DUF4197 domain-containing protein [Aquisalimonas sp.]
MRRQLFAILLVTLLASGCAGADFTIPGSEQDGSVEQVDSAEQDEGRVAGALREALRVGTERTVERTAREDGYLGNARIRIELPDELQSAATRLRAAGLGSQVDELERTMNRAAESAAQEAASVFADAIRNMRPADVYAVLNGEDAAATAYLREHSESELRQRYQPVIQGHMEQTGVYRVYQPLRNTYNQLPLLGELDLDLERYVTDRALDGLFTVLAEEEARIREDPRARTSELLRDVFGGQ